MTKADTFLSKDEQDALVKCVQEVEKTTSGEIVPMIASTSYAYPRASLIGGLIGGALIGIGAALAFGRDDMWFFLAVFLAAVLILSRLLEVFPALKKPFISKREMREEVEEAAFTAFYANGLHHNPRPDRHPHLCLGLRAPGAGAGRQGHQRQGGPAGLAGSGGHGHRWDQGRDPPARPSAGASPGAANWWPNASRSSTTTPTSCPT